MRQYNPPIIRTIELNAQQAVLQICMVGGAYWHTPTGNPVGCQATGTMIGGWCSKTPKGAPTNASVTPSFEDSSPAS